MLSTKEKSIGISRFQNGRLTFPEALPIPDDEPLLLEVGRSQRRQAAGNRVCFPRPPVALQRLRASRPRAQQRRESGGPIRSARQRRRRSRSTAPPRQRPSCDSTRRATAGRVSCCSRGPTAVRSCSLARRTGRSPPCRATAACGWATSEPGPSSSPTNPFLVTRRPRPAKPEGSASRQRADDPGRPGEFRAETAAGKRPGVARRRSIQRVGAFGPHRRGGAHQPGRQTGPRGRADRHGNSQDPRLCGERGTSFDLGRRSSSARFPTRRSAWPT